MQDSDILDEKESLGSEAMAPGGLPVFQNLLMQFLDTRAPVLGRLRDERKWLLEICMITGMDILHQTSINKIEG